MDKEPTAHPDGCRVHPPVRFRRDGANFQTGTERVEPVLRSSSGTGIGTRGGLFYLAVFVKVARGTLELEKGLKKSF